MSVALHDQRVGDGPPLVILHGLFGSGTNWRSVARALSPQREVFLPDARNHGASPHDPHMDYLALADDTLAYLDRQGLEHVDLFGHSMGGKTAMCVALQHPQRVRSLMIVDIAPSASPSDHRPLLALMRALPLSEFTRRSEAEAAMAKHIKEPAMRAFIAQNLVSRDSQLTWRVNLAAIEAALPDLLGFPLSPPQPAYSGDTLFLHGGKSNYLRQADHAPIKALFPTARIEAIADAGHWLHAEQPEQFVRAAQRFLGIHGE